MSRNHTIDHLKKELDFPDILLREQTDLLDEMSYLKLRLTLCVSVKHVVR